MCARKSFKGDVREKYFRRERKLSRVSHSRRSTSRQVDISRLYIIDIIYISYCVSRSNEKCVCNTHEMRVPGGERDRVRGSGLATVKVHLSPSRGARRAAPGRLDQLHLDPLRRELHLRARTRERLLLLILPLAPRIESLLLALGYSSRASTPFQKDDDDDITKRA